MKNTWWLILCLVVVLVLGAVGCARGASVSLEANGANTNTAIHTAAVIHTALDEPHLIVDLSAPGQVMESDDFAVTAVVTNEGQEDATAKTNGVTMTATGPASPSPQYDDLPAIPAGDSVKVEFTLTCNGPGGVIVTVEAQGGNTNTASDSAAVIQIALGGPNLIVDLSAPAEVTVGDDYYVTAVVTNPKHFEVSGVSATLVIEGNASTLDPLEQVIGNIPPSSSANASWMLTADAEGGVNVAVITVGTKTNIAIDSAAIQQRNGIKWDELEVVPTYGYTPLEITASAKVSNRGYVATTTEAELYVNEEVVTSKTVSLGAEADRIVSFNYVLGVGIYNVTIDGLPPIEVVVAKSPRHMYEGANPVKYPGTTADFPDVLTNIGPDGLDVALIVWLRDVSTGGDWWFYNVPQDYSHPAEFTGMVTGKVYVVVVSKECVWYVS